MTSAEHTPQKPRPRWLRFGLRTFFVLLTLTCVFFGWIGSTWIESQREEAAVGKIIAAGGLIGYDYEEPGFYVIGPSENEPYGHPVFRYLFGQHIFSRVVAINFLDGINRQPARPNEVAEAIAELRYLREIEFHTSETLDDTVIDTLSELPRLESTWFAIRSITSERLRRLSNSETIQEVILNGQCASDDHLQSLRYFSNLKLVSIYSEETTNAGILHLGDVPQLERLFIQYANITDEGLVTLTKLKHLKEFNGPSSWSVQLTPRCLPTLGKIPSLETLFLDFEETETTFDTVPYESLLLLTNLRKLSLMDKNLEDEAVPIIGKMTQLRELSLSGTKISDEALSHLANLHQLESLDLNFTQVTDAGLRKLEGLHSLRRLDVSVGSTVTEAYLQSQGFTSEDDSTDWYVR